MLDKLIKRPVFRGFTWFARILPLWKRARIVDVVPSQKDIPVTLPRNFSLLPQTLAEKFVVVKSIPVRSVFVLRKVYVSGSAVVFKNFRIFIPSLTWLKDLNLHRNANLLLQQWRGKLVPVPKDKRVALIFDDWSATNYYHWMIESLPRLLVVQQLFPESRVIVPTPSPEYVQATLTLMEVTDTFPLNRNVNEVLQVNELIVPELVYYDDEVYASSNRETFKPVPANELIREELIVTVRKRLLERLCEGSTAPVRKIFVSRSRQKRRTLKNENDITPSLESLGYEIVFFEGLPFIEQVRIARSARIFCSVHGANMVNILFLQSTASVIELVNKDYLNDAYYLLASSIGIPYYAVGCSMADSSLTTSTDTIALNDAHLLVDPAELENTLKLLDQPFG